MSENVKIVNRVWINAPIQQVWDTLTKEGELLPFFFNSVFHTTTLAPGAPMRMRSLDGKYTGVVGEVLEFDPGLPKWPAARRYHCAKCGSAVYWVNPDAFPEMRLVSLGCFDDPSAWGLARTVQNQYRPDWCPRLVSSETYDEQPG